MREATGGILGHPLNNRQWIQATLPVSMGGMGFRQASLHSAASYVVSVSHSTSLVSNILGSLPYLPDSNEAIQLMNLHSSESYSFSSIRDKTKKQISYSIDHRVKSLHTACTHDLISRVRLSAVAKNHTSDWLNVLPSPALGLALHPQEFRCAARYRALLVIV